MPRTPKKRQITESERTLIEASNRIAPYDELIARAGIHRSTFYRVMAEGAGSDAVITSCTHAASEIIQHRARDHEQNYERSIADGMAALERLRSRAALPPPRPVGRTPDAWGSERHLLHLGARVQGGDDPR